MSSAKASPYPWGAWLLLDRAGDVWAPHPGPDVDIEVGPEGVLDALDDGPGALDSVDLEALDLADERVRPPGAVPQEVDPERSRVDPEFDPVDHCDAVEVGDGRRQGGVESVVVGDTDGPHARPLGGSGDIGERHRPVRVVRVDVEVDDDHTLTRTAPGKPVVGYRSVIRAAVSAES